MAEKQYNFQCVWSTQDGCHFSLGKKRMWEVGGRFIVADVVIENKQERYENHNSFSRMNYALTYMREAYDKEQNP